MCATKAHRGRCCAQLLSNDMMVRLMMSAHSRICSSTQTVRGLAQRDAGEFVQLCERALSASIGSLPQHLINSASWPLDWSGQALINMQAAPASGHGISAVMQEGHKRISAAAEEGYAGWRASHAAGRPVHALPLGPARLRLGHDQRRRQADDVALRRLGQHAGVAQAQAHVVRARAGLLVDDDRVQQALAAYLRASGASASGPWLCSRDCSRKGCAAMWREHPEHGGPVNSGAALLKTTAQTLCIRSMMQAYAHLLSSGLLLADTHACLSVYKGQHVELCAWHNTPWLTSSHRTAQPAASAVALAGRGAPAGCAAMGWPAAGCAAAAPAAPHCPPGPPPPAPRGSPAQRMPPAARIGLGSLLAISASPARHAAAAVPARRRADKPWAA